MKVRYRNQQDKLDPMNQAEISGSAELVELLQNRRSKPPSIADLFADNGFRIMFGLGPDFGCADYSRSNGDLPYLMAVSPRPPMKSGYAEFLAGGTLTPFAARYIISFDELQQVLIHFLETGQRSNAVLWQDFDAEAMKEALGRYTR